MPDAPGVYRLVWRAIDGDITVYIGEAVNVSRRMRNYGAWTEPADQPTRASPPR